MLNYKFWIILVISALFIAGCAARTSTAPQKPVQEVTKKETKKTKKVYASNRVHRKVTLKEVQDNNYSSEYMYPEDKVKKEKVAKVSTPPVKTETETETTTTSSSETATITEIETPSMNKVECIGMIGQEKFDKYTLMFGNEASSIKRCAMLKAMH